MEDYIRVVINKSGIVIDFECKFNDVENAYTKKEIVGTNWFNSFIEKFDLEDTKKVFQKLYESGISSDTMYHTNDIRCKNNRHKLIDFENNVEILNGEKVIVSIGKEHYSHTK